jgi:hypothetical protein
MAAWRMTDLRRAALFAVAIAAAGTAARAEAPAPSAGAASSAVPSSGGEKAWPAGNPIAGIPLAALTQTRDRPLFSASRRPPAVVEAAAPPSPPAPAPVEAPRPQAPQFELVGTIINPTSAIALVRSPSSDSVSKLRVGEETDGWRVQSVAPRSIVVESGAQTVTLGFPAPPPDNATGDQQPAPNVSFNEEKKGRHPIPRGD